MIIKLLNLLGIYYEPFTWIDAFFVGISIILMVFDTVLIIFAKKIRPRIENRYYDFHRKHGMLKITLIKPLIIYAIIYLDSTGDIVGVYSTGAIMLAYGYLIIKLLTDLLKQKNDRRKNEERKGKRKGKRGQADLLGE
jgi:hypothetical protein